MTNLKIETRKSYEDEFIEFVEISQDDINRHLADRTSEKQILEITETGSIEADSGDLYVGDTGCKLDLEVITPRPDITVQVSTESVKQDGVDYGYWNFESTRQFENWIDSNPIKLVDK